MVDLGQATNTHVQCETRPVLVISNDANNCFSGSVNAIPLTTKKKRNLPSHVTVRGFGLKMESTVACEQITTLDKARLKDKNYIGHIDDPAVLEKILQAIIVQTS